MPGPFRLQSGPAGDLWTYATAAGAGGRSGDRPPVGGHIVVCHDLPRAKASAADVAVTYPALADRLARETGWLVVTGTLRGAGRSAGDFSGQGWLDDLAFLMEGDIPADGVRWLVGFGFGGVLALHLAARDDRVGGVACLGTPATLDALTADPEVLIGRCAATGLISTSGYPQSPEAWVKELSDLRPLEDAGMLKGRPLLVVHGADDPDNPVDDARALADAATGPSDLRLVYGAGHWLRADPRVIAILAGWLERCR